MHHLTRHKRVREQARSSWRAKGYKQTKKKRQAQPRWKVNQPANGQRRLYLPVLTQTMWHFSVPQPGTVVRAGSFLSYRWIIYLRAGTLSKKRLCIFPLELPFILSSSFFFHHQVGKLPKDGMFLLRCFYLLKSYSHVDFIPNRCEP